MKRHTPILALATVAIIGASYLRWAPSNAARPSAPSISAAALEQSATTGRSEVARLIDNFEREVAAQPTATGFKFLAQMYLQRGRLTGDVATYAQAQAALDRALQLAPGDTEAAGLAASVLATTHDFDGAARKARTLLAENPNDLSASAVLGDAQIELGDYTDAFATYSALSAVAADSAAVIVRQARIAFLNGNVDEARRLAKHAKQQAMASAFGDAGLAFYTTVQGQIEHDSGHYDSAGRFYAQALREAPGYYIALAGLAREQAAHGQLGQAIATYERAVAVVPQPDTVAALGDLYHLRGDEARAKAEYDTVVVIGTLAAINKQVYNRALAVFDADHGVNVDDAVRLTQAELSARHDVYGYDAAAWALHKAGDERRADDAATHAIALGTRDARLYYHAGIIANGLGDAARAATNLRRALDISPNFDPVQAPIARNTLATLNLAIGKGQS